MTKLGIAAIGAAPGLLSSFISSKNQKDVLAAQSAENRINRQFNAKEAQKSRDFSEYMFDRTNSYNDPSQVVSRLSAAGLHPALAFGGFQNASFGGSSAQASSSSSVNPPALDTSGITHAGTAALEAINQSKLVDAEVALKDSERKKNEAELPWIDKINSTIESLNKEDVNLKITQQQLNKTNKQVLEKTLNEIDEKIKNLRQDRTESNARIAQIFKDVKLKDAQINELNTLLQYKVKELIAHANNLDADTNLKNFDLTIKRDMLSRFGLEALSDQQFRMVNEQLDSLGQALRESLGDQVGDSLNNWLQGIARLIGRVFH